MSAYRDDQEAAALRAEVETLRARVARAEEEAPVVWTWRVWAVAIAMMPAMVVAWALGVAPFSPFPLGGGKR